MTTASTDIKSYWLRNKQFDLVFILGVFALAVSSGTLVTLRPDLFVYVLTADLWLLGYHHVASTYTRLAFDTDSLREHRLKLTVLPVLVAGGVTSILLVFGPWMIASIYLYWQWYHYTRQSEGISKAYAAKSKQQRPHNQQLQRAVFWLVPLAGLICVSSRSPESFLFMPLKTIPVPDELALFFMFLAAVAYIWWLITQTTCLFRRQISLPWYLYMNTHFIIYAAAYVILSDINHGWLIINIWHNAQYILFVWLYNNKRFNGEMDEKHVFLSTISKNRNLIIYLGVCFALSSGAYFLIERVGVDIVELTLGVSSLAAAMIIYQTINFHHYIVDASIWKLRKKPMQQTLGI